MTRQHSFIAPPHADRSSAPGAALADLLARPPEALAEVPVEVMNLLCATGLQDRRELDLAACLRTLERWTEHVRQETQRHLYLYQRAPADYEGSEAYFRILLLLTVLQQDCGVRYDLECSQTTLFRCSGEGFIHGLLDGRGLGTCANLPVLYVALGRKLGYPLHLCLAKGHVFCRWEDERQRFNIEGSGTGLCTPPDAHYLTWPKTITPQELRRVPFLRNMNPAEELALFLGTRGHCLVDAGRYGEAVEAFAAARRYAPEDPHYRAFLADATMRRNQQQSTWIATGQYDNFSIFRRV